VIQRLPSRRIEARVDVSASGISRTNAVNPTVTNGRLPMSSMIAAKSRPLSSTDQVRKCAVA